MTVELFNQFENLDLSINYYQMLFDKSLADLEHSVDLATLIRVKMFLNSQLLMQINQANKFFINNYNFDLKVKQSQDGLLNLLDCIICFELTNFPYKSSYFSIILEDSDPDVQGNYELVSQAKTKILDLYIEKNIFALSQKGFNLEHLKSTPMDYISQNQLTNSSFNYLLKDDEDQAIKEFFDSENKLDHRIESLCAHRFKMKKLFNKVYDLNNPELNTIFNRLQVVLRNIRLDFIKTFIIDENSKNNLVNLDLYINEFSINLYTYIDLLVINDGVLSKVLEENLAIETFSMVKSPAYDSSAVDIFYEIYEIFLRILELEREIFDLSIINNTGFALVKNFH